MHGRKNIKRTVPKRTLPWIALVAAWLPFVALAGPVNVNTADAATLARELKGIGLARAQAIVDYRQKNGPFKSADELTRVKGIGTRVVSENRDNIKLDEAEKATASPAPVARGKNPSAKDKAKVKATAKPQPKDD